MDDAELTRKAIEELIREMDGKETARGTPLERKKNPIGKPNKRFLDRTLNSVMQHNNRAIVRAQVSSRRKLREMDDRDRRRANNAFFNGGCRKDRDRYKYPKTRESRSSSRSSRSRSSKRSNTSRKQHVKKRKRKKNKHTKHKDNGNSSQSRSRTRSRSPRSSQRKEKINLKMDHEIIPPIDERFLESYFMQSNATAFAAMAFAYNQMQEVIRCENVSDLTTITPETLNNDEFSDLSLSSSLSQELSMSEESENVHSDEDGILTINLSSSGEDEDADNNLFLNSTNLREKNDNSSSSSSCISVESNDTEAAYLSANVNSKEDIHVLSSGNSDDEIEIISEQRVPRDELTFDLTEN